MTAWFSVSVNWVFQLRTFWWPEISWKRSSLAVMWGSLFGRENCFCAQRILTKEQQFSWTFPAWLVAVMSVSRETGAWFGKLSWHLKVPWHLISAKRVAIHRVPTQIEGGTAAVGVFCFEDNDGMIQCHCKLSFPTAELTFWWPEISWKPSSVAVTWGSLFGREKNFLNTFTQRIFA